MISFVGICDLVCEEQKVQINQHPLNSNQKQASWFKIPPAPFESISCCDGKCGGGDRGGNRAVARADN